MAARWCTIAPVSLGYRGHEGGLTEPFDLGNDVVLGLPPDWLSEEPVTELMSFFQQEVCRRTELAFRVEYEADSLGDPLPGRDEDHQQSKQRHAQESLLLANLALWLARPSPLAYPLMIHAECQSGSWKAREIFSVGRFCVHVDDDGNSLSVGDLRNAREINLSIQGLHRAGSLWTALRVLAETLREKPWEIRYPLLWIALEALFGPENPGETTYRIAQRIAFFRASDRAAAHDIFRKTKEAYRWRSRAVHGMRLRRLEREKSGRILYEAERSLRESLQKILRSRELSEVFSGSGRDEYLDGLVFLLENVVARSARE